jgi:hypothetical protein
MLKILIKRGTETQWTSSTTPLLAGELGLDTTNNILKAGNGTALWSSLSGLTLTSTQVNELAQDAIGLALNHNDHSNIVVSYSDVDNKITLSSGPDLVTFSDLGNSLGDYIPLSYYGNADGVATLDENSLIPDAQIPSSIARDSELFSGSYNDLTDKPTLFSGSYNDLSDKPTIPSLTGYATETYVGTAISNLVDSAPTTLNTLNELAAALGDDPNYATTITTALGDKVSKSGGDTITTSSASVKGLIIKGAASQTAKLQEWQNSGSLVVASMDDSGKLVVPTIRGPAGNVVTLGTDGQPYSLSISNTQFDSYGPVPWRPYNSSMVGFIVKGQASQTANLQQWQNSSGAVVASIDSLGKITSYNRDTAGGNNNLTISGYYNGSTSSLDLQSNGITRASLISSGTIGTDSSFRIHTRINDVLSERFRIATTGRVGFNTNNPSSGLHFLNTIASDVGLIVQGAASQTVNLQEWQNSSGTVLSKVDYNGIIYSPTAASGTNTTQVATTEFVQTEIISKSDKITTINAQSSNYTLATSDSDKLVEMSGGGTLTITDSSSFPVGFTCNILQTGSSQVTVAGNGFTVNATPGLKLRTQWSSATLVKRALNSWVLMGDLSA